MNRKVFRKTLFFILLIFFHSSLYSIPLDNIKEYTLENGLTVFILQDTSTPLIRVEYTVRAGFSNQTRETSGFFKLYSRIFEASCASQKLNLESAECNADSSCYVITTVPSKLKETLAALAQTAFSPNYSDQLLLEQLSALKKEVSEEANSPTGFINMAIDSRVFSDSPWKHDSGVYPSLFNKTTASKARNILSSISDHWYLPQNSAVFISGNINADTILSLIQDTFGHYYSTVQVPVSRKSVPKNQKKKFVLHSPDFSADMTQIVVQYTSLSMEETEFAATVLDNNASTFKNTLSSLDTLAIPGNEYINAAAAHKKDCSRLIIQSLLQKPQGKNAANITSDIQAKLFLETAVESIKNTNEMEFLFAKYYAGETLDFANTSSVNFMSSLSAYWAAFPYDSFLEENLDSAQSSSTANAYFSRSSKIQDINSEELISKLLQEEPFVFVIINSADYKKNRKAYSAAGFEEINSQNAAWYNQKIFANLNDEENEDVYNAIPGNLVSTDDINRYTGNYYNENIEQIKKASLSNGIQIVTKQNNNSSGVTLMLSISGGKLSSSENNGFEEVLINLLSQNIQKEIIKKQSEAIINYSVSVDYSCELMTGTITIDCDKRDFAGCCSAISDAIIYGEIIPSQADRAISNRQYKKRLENGTVSFQMLSAIMKELYPKSGYPKIFEAKKDVLTNTSYQQILESYPSLLNAGRYSIIITGEVPDNAINALESTMGLLTSKGNKIPTQAVQSKLKNGSTKKTVKVNHTFLTDIPAEKAGPMPSKLIPTTKFLDPVIYIFKIPEAGTKEHVLTQAIFKYLEKLVQEQIDSNGRLKDAKAMADDYHSGTDIITFSIMNTENQKEADACFSAAVTKLNSLLNSEKQNLVVREIKDTWIEFVMQDTLSNQGTARLLQKGLEMLPSEFSPEYYLKEYQLLENADREAFISVLKEIPTQAPLRYYAK